MSAMTLSHSRRSVWCTFGVASVQRCEALLFPRYFIVVRTAFAPFSNVCLHPCHCALLFTMWQVQVSQDFPSLESIEEGRTLSSVIIVVVGFFSIFAGELAAFCIPRLHRAIGMDVGLGRFSKRNLHDTSPPNSPCITANYIKTPHSTSHPIA